MYKCECCDKEIIKTFNWKSHIETDKHISNLKVAKIKHKKLKICDKCHSVFINISNYNNHKKKCDKNLFELNDKIYIEKLNSNEENDKDKDKNKEADKFKEADKPTEDNFKYEKEINKFKEDILKYKEEINKLRHQVQNFLEIEKENIKLKEEVKSVMKLEKENFELKGELKDLRYENKLLNDKVHQILTDSKIEVKQVITESNNEFKEIKNNIMKICDKQLDFAQNVSKDSNKITSSAMTLLGFLQKRCPNAPPLLEFTKDNYEYTFIFDKDFVYDILYAFDNDTAGEFIGKIVNEMFLKDNKEDQSMFATDTVRLNYSIKEYINENKNKWVIDKGANKVTKIIINPLLTYFIKELKSFLQKENNKMMLSGTKKKSDNVNIDDDIKKIEYKEESDTSSEDEGWRTPKNKKTEFTKCKSNINKNSESDNDKHKKTESSSESSSDLSSELSSCEEDYMLRSVKSNNLMKPLINVDKTQIKNSDEYH